MRRGLVVLSLILLTSSAATAAPRNPERPHVTLISDSVAGSLVWDAPAARIFAQGLDVDLELDACRRLATQSCPAGHVIPPSALDLIRAKGRRLGRNVVIAVGYNDFPAVYASGIGPTLRALRAAGVQHVFWLTLRAVRHPYVESNAAIRASAEHHPELTVLDWNAHSRNHPEWFQADGLHLVGTGARALARFMHDGVLKALLAPPPIDVSLVFPQANVTAGFAASLRAHGGKAPYRFSVRGLPRGLRAHRDGTIEGLPPSGSWALHVHVTDAKGAGAATTITLVVSRARRVAVRSR